MCALGARCARAMRRPPTSTGAGATGKEETQMTDGRVNPQCRLEDQGITGLRHGLLQPERAGAGRSSALKRGEGQSGQWRRAAGHHRQAHRPLAEGQVRGAHARRSKTRIWWENNAPMTPDGLRPCCMPTCWRICRAATTSCRISTPAPIRRIGWTCAMVTELAWHGAVHPPPAAPPVARASWTASLPDFTIINCPTLQGRSGPPRLPLGNRHRAEFRQAS